MIKFMMLLAMAALIGAIFFGIMNQQTLNAQVEKISQLDQQFGAVSRDVVEAEGKLQEASTALAAANTAKQEVQGRLSLTKNDLMRKDTETKRLDETLTKMTSRMEELKIMEDKLGGMTPEQLNRDLETVNSQYAAKQEEMKKLESDLLAANTKSEENATKIEKLKAAEEQRRKQIAGNALQATIIAVNQDFGFVIVNAGSDLGVTADTSFLVQRDVDRIGRLRIVSVEPTLTVADIVPGSLSPGARIMVRDKVIFESAR